MPIEIHSIETSTLDTDPHVLDRWLHDVEDLHGVKAPATVHYSGKMPNVDDLLPQLSQVSQYKV